MERWHNKVAVVTGASSGIGESCVKELLANSNMIVVGLARRYERMENELKKSLPEDQRRRFHALKCDVSKEEDILKTFVWIEKHLDGVDVLINNAGVLRHHTELVAKNNTADLRAIVDTNLMGTALCAREAFHSMKKRAVAGHIININSILGHVIPQVPGFTFNIYPPTKHAVTALTEILRQEFQNHGTQIKVSSISPGAVDTEMFDKDELPSEIAILTAKDIADAVLYCIKTPPNVQIHEMIIKPVGEKF